MLPFTKDDSATLHQAKFIPRPCAASVAEFIQTDPSPETYRSRIQNTGRPMLTSSDQIHQAVIACQ